MVLMPSETAAFSERLCYHLLSTFPLPAPQAWEEITLPHLVARSGPKLRALTWDASRQRGN